MQLAAITINDGKATPVSHVFTPTKISGSTAVLNERVASGIAIGYPMLQFSVTPADAFNGVNRVDLKIAMPQLEVISGSDAGYTPAPAVAFTDTVKVSFLLPGRSTTANRKDLRVLLINALQNSIVVDAVDNMAPAY